MKKKKENKPQIPEEATVAEMQETEEKDGAISKMEEDIECFRQLFPEVKADEIPQEVWDRVEEGESLSAAFALHFVKEMREKEHIRRVNEENGKKAPPPVEGQGSNSDYFSPEAVKSMSRKEIRANYDKILSSMEKWN